MVALCSRRGSAQEVAEAAGTNRITLYKWKSELLSKESFMPKSKKDDQGLPKYDIQMAETLAFRAYSADVRYVISECGLNSL